MNRLVVLDTNCLVQMLSIHSPYRSAWQAFRDGKYILCVDNKFVDCAIVSGADYIVSEDAHFRILDTIPFPKVFVVRLEKFVAEIANY